MVFVEALAGIRERPGAPTLQSSQFRILRTPEITNLASTENQPLIFVFLKNHTAEGNGMNEREKKRRGKGREKRKESSVAALFVCEEE